MSTAALKLTTLLIRTLSKPIATSLKTRARSHPTFRHACISLAQSLHRFDMRLRLGLLPSASPPSPEEIVKEKARRREEALKKIQQAQKEAEVIYPGASGWVRSDVLAPGALDELARKAAEAEMEAEKAKAEAGEKGEKHTPVHPRIRPLSESKAIDAGANFISEAFLFSIAASLILFEALRSRRKETKRQDTVAERLEKLEERGRQDLERLVEMERREREVLEELWRVEVRLWEVGGRKGRRPELREVEGREWKVLELGVEQEEGKGWWGRVWNLGKRGEVGRVLTARGEGEGGEKMPKEERKEQDETKSVAGALVGRI